MILPSPPLEMPELPLNEWLEHLETLHPREMELGLERVRRVAQSLNLLPVTVPVVTVAGTNGKGSTCAVLESLLLSTGHRPGCFTSPHFLRFNERIRVAGQEAADEAITSAFAEIEAARGETSLTYFEFATLAALLVFRQQEVDIMVLEVGLGGRLDSVNIVDPTVAVITSIDLDHQDWLGDTREKIALEKAGILRCDRPAVIADPDVPMELLEYADELGVRPVLLMGRDLELEPGPSDWSGRIVADGTLIDVAGETGELLPQNICAAMQAAACLGIQWSADEQATALSSVVTTGRRQWLEQGGIHYLLDVAHNPAAINKMLESIDATSCNGKIIALFSVMGDKSVAEMLACLAGRFDGWFLGDQPDNPRAMPAAELAQLLRGEGEVMISLSKNLRQAYRRAQSVMSQGDTLVVFGSFFTVAAILPLLEKDRRKIGNS